MKIGTRVRIPGVGRFENPDLGTVVDPEDSEPDEDGMVMVEWDSSAGYTQWEYEADLEEV